MIALEKAGIAGDGGTDAIAIPRRPTAAP